MGDGRFAAATKPNCDSCQPENGMDHTMNALSVRALAAAGAAALAVIVALSGAAAPVLAGLALAAVIGLVAFAAQSRALRDERRLVYRPVYVRRHDVQRRVMSDSE